jgi:hypothetical protein
MSAVVRLESHGFADALVRSQKNTKGDATEVTLAPICEGAEGRCGAGQIVAVPFNTRSYFQRSYGGTCDATPFGASDYSCVDYGAGKIVFSGQSLTFEVDLSGDGCGCNAALYLVSMPQSHNESQCHDFYCDANNVCGVRCDEIDLMEANTVAWVSTVHVGDDGAGEGFGYAHYVFPQEKRLRSPTHDCAYGPSPECAVNTLYPFGVNITFTPSEEVFGYWVVLSQVGRTASLGPVRYVGRPQQGSVLSADEANAQLRASLDAGMTLVVSHWAGSKKSSMAWLDAPCAPSEISGWACNDIFVEHPEWPWLCPVDDESHSSCPQTFTIRDIALSGQPPAPPLPPPYMITFEELTTNVTVGVSFGLLLGMAIGVVLTLALLGPRKNSHERVPVEQQEMASSMDTADV